jgi:hypothetical protein
MSYDLRLRAYQPGTDTPLGVLPAPLSWQASVVHNNDGALTVKYSELAEGGAIAARGLNAGLDVALEVNWLGGPADWVEPDNCRYLMVGDDYDKTDTARVHDLTLPSWSWLLNKVCDLNTGALQGKKSKYAGQRLFPASSDAGDVCKKMLDEHDARSGPAVPVLRDSWSTTKDSGGNSWAKKLGKNAEGRAFPAGQPLHDKLDALVKNGLCDWRTRGRGLRIYNPSSASADLSATVRLLYGDDLTDAPSKTSQADRVARVLVKGDGKHKVTVKDPSVPELYGRWEAMIDSAGVKDDDDLEDTGNAELDDRNRIKGEYTRTLTMSGKWLPFRDYQVGDWVTAPGADGDERLRVMQITITRDEQNGLSGNIVLGDRFTAKDLALAGRVSAITGGTTGVIGNGTTVQVEPQDFRQPAAPTGLTVTGTLYQNPFGEWRVRLSASWAAVTAATDGTALDVSGYELWGQPQGQTPAAAWRRITSASGTSVEWPDFMVGSAWLFTVRALGVTTTEPGVQSATASITFGTDTEAPNGPATPTVSSYLGALVTAWSGLDHMGGEMPADFVRCEVHLSTTSGFTPDLTASSTTRKASFLRGGTVTLSGLTYGTTYYVRLVAVDMSGNYSVPSAQASGVPQRAVSNDMAQAAIDAIRDYTITTVRPSIDAKNSILTGTATPPASYTGVANDKYERRNASGALIAVYRWTGTAWESVPLDPVYIPQIDIGAGTFGSLAGSRLEVGSVLANKVLIGAFDNLIANGGCETGNVSPAQIPTGTMVASPTYFRSGSYGFSYLYAGNITTTTDLVYWNGPLNDSSYHAPVSQGDQLYYEYFIKALSGTQSPLAAAIKMRAADGTLVQSPSGTSVTPTTSGWSKVAVTATVPEGVAYAVPYIVAASGAVAGARVIFDDAYFRRMVTGSLIVDGGITANKMSSTDIFTINTYWGPTTGTHLRAEPNNGFQAWTANPSASNAIQQWMRIGSTTSKDAISIGFDAANPVASITSDGHSGFQSVSTEALRVGGEPLDEILAPLPRGMIAYTAYTAYTTAIDTTEAGVVELRCTLQPGRTYTIDVSNLAISSTVANNRATSTLRYSLDGAAVSTSSTALRSAINTVIPVTGEYMAQPSFKATLNTAGWAAEREVRLLVGVRLYSGSGSLNAGGSSALPLQVVVEDKGVSMAATTTTKLWTTTWNASAMYQNGAGSVITSGALASARAFANESYLHCLFNNTSIKGQAGTVATVTSGATITKAEVYLYNNGTLGSLLPRGMASTATAATATVSGSVVDGNAIAQAAGAWIDITSIWSTSHRSVHLRANGLSYVIAGETQWAETYGTVLNTTARPVQLRLTYIK